ncbi:uncharacterized protein K460DRAFT_318814 [Cucurbitaria berberidis CBS 394.84]|uniref:Vacuolar protein sorting-associated protein 62 n=1 Tax=Cucurbitaria berberidis CBS 394.84 TaxID=1168544 RepID=A0A9P4L4S8_9PLEO|nr:uncharacterized protein K460DRAFT_318814 [Cucurbitaria berberidis CBS 394.84]KAF1841627.1 hypothetical protein K460DRAFT_318814 [Cucurbitaria berberidis CBS 394.84]
MVLKSLFYVAAFVASVVRSAPVKLQERQAPSGVPDYVLRYAPIVYLHSDDQYLPTDIQTFLDNTTPRVNFNEVSGPSKPLTSSNVNQMGGDVWLTSNDDVTKDPQWIKGTKPDSNGRTNEAVTAAVIVNDKGNGNVDAFYMYFYAYNYGGDVIGWKKLNFGNHVGDWEHTMVRFTNGVPQALWYSQHANGQAFQYSTVEKSGDRPLAYSAKGSHANYAMGGTHDHTIPNFNLPGGVLQDYTNKGVMWDPLLSAYYYKFNAGANSFEAYDDSTPTNWLYFNGRWGDQEYPKSDKRQVKLFGQAKFSGGPTGPADKQLNREKICPENGKTCILRSILVPRSSGTDDVAFEGDEVII